jgi:hypothetical protein
LEQASAVKDTATVAATDETKARVSEGLPDFMAA